MKLQTQLSSDTGDMQESYRVDANQWIQIVSKLFYLYSGRITSYLVRMTLAILWISEHNKGVWSGES